MRLPPALIVASVGLQKHSTLSNPTDYTAEIAISSCFILFWKEISKILGAQSIFIIVKV